MSIGTITCLCFAGCFLIIAVIFSFLKDRGAVLISGFNTLSKQDQAQYDMVRMCLDMRNSLLIWSLIFILGAIFSFCISDFFSIAAFLAWLALFLKDVHLDAETAFERYKK